jgi:hypothetical protein
VELYRLLHVSVCESSDSSMVEGMLSLCRFSFSHAELLFSGPKIHVFIWAEYYL